MVTDTDGVVRSKLHYAAAAGDAKSVGACWRPGTDPQLGDSQGMTPLHFAAQGRHADVAFLLLDAGADVDGEDKQGNTPL